MPILKLKGAEVGRCAGNSGGAPWKAAAQRHWRELSKMRSEAQKGITAGARTQALVPKYIGEPNFGKEIQVLIHLKARTYLLCLCTGRYQSKARYEEYANNNRYSTLKKLLVCKICETIIIRTSGTRARARSAHIVLWEDINYDNFYGLWPLYRFTEVGKSLKSSIIDQLRGWLRLQRV